MTRTFVEFGVFAARPSSADQPPVPRFTATVSGLTVLLDASASTDADGTITNYGWDPGDGGVWGPNAVSYTKTYTAAGSYPVTLYVKDNAGVQRSTVKTVTVGSSGGSPNVAPTAAFTLTANNLTASVNGAASTDQDGTVTGYDWNWGDGSGHSSGVTASHTYATAGTYTVTLTVTDNQGATGTVTHSITVSTGTTANQAPTASFSWTAASLTVDVNGTSSNDADGTIARYDWNWGDSTAHSTAATASHTYATAGTYPVTLTVTDNQGATGTVTHTVTATSPTSQVPAWDHIVIVVMENKSYNEVYGSTAAPWMTALANTGVRFANSFAITHPSEPNYIAMFSGSTQGITDDNQHWSTAANIYTQMKAAGLPFKAYSESLPSTGYTGWTSGDYAARHCPWVIFQQDPTLNPGGNFDGQNHLPYTQWQQSATFYAALPRLTYVIPNVKNDIHDTTISQGDSWLQANLDGYLQWAKTHNSLLIVTFDEDDYSQNNQVYTAAGGAHCLGSTYTGTVNHHTFLGLVQDVLALPRLANSVGQPTITGCWS